MSKEKAGRKNKRSQDLAWVFAGSPPPDLASRGPEVSDCLGRTMDKQWKLTLIGKAHPFPQNLLALQSQKGTLLTHLYRLEDTGHKHRVKKSPLKWEMLTLEGKQGGKGRTMPCRVWVGNALSIACQHLPFPNPVGLSPASGTALSRLPLFHWDN